MSSLHYKITTLSLVLGITAMAGCSTFGIKKQKDVVDLGPQSTEQVYFEKAQKALAKGQYSEANKSLEAIKNYFPTGQYSEQAELELIYSKFQQKDYPATISLAERFIQQYPQHPRLDYAYYVRGVANMEQNYDSLIRYT
ncbi:MAG: outer membrane protein assembly factor BamD, partial [Acinetobacter sp.]|nr:outer membrane protein assembly factor BamD [Acinetobacter sp.]